LKWPGVARAKPGHPRPFHAWRLSMRTPQVGPRRAVRGATELARPRRGGSMGSRIPQSPPCDESRDRSEKTQPSRRALVQHVGRISRRRGGTCACRACNDKNILVIIHSKNILVLSQTRIFWCTVNTRIFLHPHNLLGRQTHAYDSRDAPA